MGRRRLRLGHFPGCPSHGKHPELDFLVCKTWQWERGSSTSYAGVTLQFRLTLLVKVMDRERVRQLLNAKVDQSVEVTWSDGSNQVVTVVTVDDEGFVYDLVPKDPKTAFWTNFDEVSNIAASSPTDRRSFDP